MNTGAPSSTPMLSLEDAEARVLEIQTKLHRWATNDPDRRFGDLFNLVCDPALLLVAWARVRTNRGARSAGVDGQTAYYITAVRGQDRFLADLRADLQARRFAPLPVRERMIPKAGGKLRRLGIPTVRDRVAQAALKLVLEPIFEAGFQPCSFGFRPGRRAQDAIAEIHHFGSHGYQWVLEADIEACFDTISHPALMERVRRRVTDKRVLGLVKAFLKAGVLQADGTVADREASIGTPQGGILSPLLANIALSVLDDWFVWEWQAMGCGWQRHERRVRGQATFRLVRYADDFVVMVAGTAEHARALQARVEALLAPMGLRLSTAKTRVVHLDEGFQFLGFYIQQRRKPGAGGKRCIYTYPSKKALRAVVGKVRALTNRKAAPSLLVLLHQVNRVLRGWCAYFRYGVSKDTFQYLEWYAYVRVKRWLRKRHRGPWARLRQRYLADGTIGHDGVMLFAPGAVKVSRYRWRAHIPTPWPTAAATQEPTG